MRIGARHLAASWRAFLAAGAVAITFAGVKAVSPGTPATHPARPVAAAASTRTAMENGAGRYPRAIRLQHNGSANGSIVASVTSNSAGNGIALIYQSTDDGKSFQQIATIADPTAAAGTGQCCATLYELPSAVGGNPAGTLLWAASIGGQVTTDRRMQVRVWRSTDAGHTWSFLSTIATASNDKGLWEPEFTVDSSGELVAFYSDETDSAHSQKLMKVRTVDGINWTGRAGVVVASNAAYRPGMAVVRRLPDGSYLMSYELCGTGEPYGCAAYTRSSADGWNWGTASSLGTRAVAANGDYFRHAPTIAVSSGTLLLIGQLLYNSGGAVASGNGATIFARPLGGSGAWHEFTAPVSVPDATNDSCPNYSSAMLPSADGRSVLEIASDWDGTTCKPYYATGPIIAASSSSYFVSFDSQAYVTKGTVGWSGTSETISGSVKSGGACAQVSFTNSTGVQHRTACNGTTLGYGFSMPDGLPSAGVSVDLLIQQPDGSWLKVNSDSCVPTSQSCRDA